MQATRPSGSKTTGFYRPGERSEIGAPFAVTPTKCPKYNGPPSGRAAGPEEKRCAWQLQEEYLAGRLGKNAEENSTLWNTAKWIDLNYRAATMPAEAVKTLNCFAGGWKDVADPDELVEGFELERVTVDSRDKERLPFKISDYDLVRLVDDFDGSAKIDINKLAHEAGPRPIRTDLPGPIERQDAIKVIRLLMARMHSLWHPVKRSTIDHVTMTSLGKTQNVGDGVAAAVGRQRVVEGLRIAEAIRKGHTRQERNRYKLVSVDEIIRETLAVIAAGVVGKFTDKPSPANDNYRADASNRAA
jgi:hypothetical protein